MIHLSTKQLFERKIAKFILYVILLILCIFILWEILSKFWILDKLEPYTSQISEILHYSLPLSGSIQISLLSIISFTFILFIWLNVGRIFKKFIYDIRKKRKDISHGTFTIIANIGYYIIVTIVVLTSLKVIGIDLSSFAMIVSALSVWIWFWLQTIVSNFISGIILMFEQSIKEWDYIEIGTDLRGTVQNINMRSTTIRTNNNIDIVVPNQSFIQNNIVNWTHHDKVVRLKIPFWVAYGTKFEKVEKVILDALDKSELNYIKDDDSKKPMVVMSEMWTSSVDLFLLIWVDGTESNNPFLARSVYLKLIYATLNKHKITIPFPQTDLHIKDSIPLELVMKK